MDDIEIEIIEAANLPKRIDRRWLAKISDERLIEVHFAASAECKYYQDTAHGRQLMNRADRVDDELIRRGLSYDLNVINGRVRDGSAD